MPKKKNTSKIDFSLPHKTNSSKLAPFIKDLRLARSNHWPLKMIKKWLKDEHRVSVSISNLGSFCTRHGLLKGGEIIESQTEKIPELTSRKRAEKTSEKKKKKFSFGAKEQEEFRKRVTGQ